MKVQRIFGFAAVCLILFAFTATADAAYRRDQDLTLGLNVAPSLLQPSGSTGTLTFDLQESAHDVITETTGLEVDHSYVWVEVNGVPVLAVDPFCVYTYDRGGTED